MMVAALLDQARRTPAKTALVFNDVSYSYDWLARSIEGAARVALDCRLDSRGITLVAVRTLSTALVTSLALRRLGAITMIASSIEQLATVALPGVSCVTVAGESGPALADACSARGLPLHTLPAHSSTPSGAARLPEVAEGGHVLQTSGTTGVPKYVFYDPAFEVPFIKEWFGIVGLDKTSTYGAFDFPLWTAVGYRAPMAAWLAGATIAIQQDRPNYQLLRNRDLTRATLIPAMLQTILAAPHDAFAPNLNLQIAIVGASLSRDLVEEARARITPHIENRIGSTETRTIATTPLLAPDDHIWHRPAPGATVEIVDEGGQPLPAGRIGRLRVGTEGGPTGYLADEVTTREFFRDGFFYTGDLAQFRADGRFALQGRVTDVVNVSGFKIAPAPIEQRLCDALGLRGLCLLSMPAAHGGEDLSVVIESDGPVDTDALGAALRRELAVFPQAHLFYTRKLPRNAMGKLMRDEVKALVAAQPSRV